MALVLVDVSNPFQDFQAGFSENSSTEKKFAPLVVGRFQYLVTVLYNAVDMKTVPRRKIRLIESNAKLSLSKKIDL
jgi:hypothetical protein